MGMQGERLVVLLSSTFHGLVYFNSRLRCPWPDCALPPRISTCFVTACLAFHTCFFEVSLVKHPYFGLLQNLGIRCPEIFLPGMRCRSKTKCKISYEMSYSSNPTHTLYPKKYLNRVDFFPWITNLCCAPVVFVHKYISIYRVPD